MMPGRGLIIERLCRSPSQGPEDNLVFGAGVNVIVGAPNTGKSKWLRMLDYLMGDDGKPEDIFEELYEKYDSASASCKIADEPLTIERRWKEAGVKTKVFVDGEGMPVKEFRGLLMERLGIPVVHYPQGNPYGPRSWPELGWRSLFRHVYRRQLMWSDLADQQPESEQHACLLQFLGIAQYLFSHQYANLVSKEKKIQELQMSREQFLGMMEEVTREILADKAVGVALTPDSIAAAERRIQEEIKEKQQKRGELIAETINAATAAPGPLQGKRDMMEQMSQDLIRLRTEQEAIISGLRKTQDRLSESRGFRVALTDELARMERAREAGKILPDLQITHCPACDREIEQKEESSHCFLCKRPFPDEASASVAADRRLDFEREQLQEELREADELIAALEREESSLSEGMTKIGDEIRHLEANLRPARAAMASLLPPEISVLDLETGRREERLQQIERVKVSMARRDKLAEEITAIQQQVDVLEAEVREQSRQIDFERAGTLLEHGMNTYLNRINKLNQHSWTQDRIHVRISDKDFRIKVGKSHWKAKLGGTLTLYFLLSYHYALMNVTAEEGCHFPGLTILDFPAHLEDGTQIKDKENFVVEPFGSRRLIMRFLYLASPILLCWGFTVGVLAVENDAGIVPKGAKLEKLWAEGEFTEGPAQAPDGAILFSDIGNRIMKFDPATGKTTEFRNPSGRSNGLDFDPRGRLVACEGANAGGNRRVSITEKDGTVRTLAGRWKGKRFNSPNDLTIDTKGRVYFTDPRYVGNEPRELDHESVYRVDPDGTVERIIKNVEKPNGIILSPDMKTLYLADNSPRGKRQLLTFPLHTDGTVGDRRVLHDFGTGRGIDGMSIDVKGNLYATAGTGNQAGVHVFNPDGKKIGFIPTPETPTNCVFGGTDRKTLYITAGKSLYRIPVLNEGFAVFRPKSDR
jgi:sugar lactone lactonase YvrE